jgi:aryl-alcohol dehydrogenase-like predicted oxidoreductase
LAVGLLSGRFRRGQKPPEDTYWSEAQLQTALSERVEQVVQTLVGLAQERDATPAQLAVAWLLDRPEVTAPIVGADRPDYVDDVFGALELKLTTEERQALDEVSRWAEPT